MKSITVVTGIFLFTFSGWANVFLETFVDENLEDWREITMQDLDVAASWKVTNGQLRGINLNGLIRLLVTKNEMWRDYSVKFEVKPLEKRNNGNIMIAVRIQKNYGVICMVGDLFFPELGSNARCLMGNFHGDFRMLKQAPHKLLHNNKWSTLQLSINGNMLTFWVNGKQVLEPMVLEPEDGFSNLARGGAGLGLANYIARFDNFMITPNPNSVIPRMKLTTSWARLKRF